MIQGKTDPRRSDRVQRYKAPQANGNTPVEDLTPDYMNILGHESTSAGSVAAAAASAPSNEPDTPADEQLPPPIPMECDANFVNNIIPTSPQYGVAIITNNTVCAQDSAPGSSAHDTANDNDPCNKDVVMHTTPSRTNHINSNNDRFKVVKIATLEPFRRGRWKCMDYVDENPPTSTSAASICKGSSNNASQQQQQYLQTQSLPQQHFQQMHQQFYQNMSAAGAQVQFFYPPQSTAQQQANTTTFINAGGGAAAGATYYQQVIPNSSGGMTLVNYPGVQYVPANLIQNQGGSAFVPTSQNINTATQLPPNLQQSQTYGGPSSNVPTGGGQQSQQQAPLVNGHAFCPATPAAEAPAVATVAQQTASVTTNTLPTHAQVAKNVILATQQSLPMQPVPPAAGQYPVPNQQSVAATPPLFQTSTSTQSTPILSAIITPSSLQAPVSNQQTSIATTVTSSNNNIVSASMDVSSAAAAAAAVYSNPQFVASVNKIVESAVSMIDAAAANVNATVNPIQQGTHQQHNVEVQGEGNNGEQTGPSSASVSGEDTTTKANPVVNAIDNKIEQAMDLVKSHLMFTVREEVEVLKEKIAELMERIQQLESENNILRTQLPKQHVLIQQQQQQQQQHQQQQQQHQQQQQQQQQQQHQTQQQGQQTTNSSNLSTDNTPSSGQQQQQTQQPQH